MKRPADQMLGLMGLIAIGGSDFYPALTHQQKSRPNLTKLHALCEEYNLIQYLGESEEPKYSTALARVNKAKVALSNGKP